MTTSHDENSQQYARTLQDKNDSSPTATLFRTLLSNPTKRALILQLLSMDESAASPIKTNSQALTSSALRNKTLDPNRSECLNGILKNIVAYVELCGKDGCDRSAGAKTLMQSLGATVRDTFTNDVTHVIFKNGTFDTYLKAKKNNVHLVSVLWLEAVRNSNTLVAEKDYPALGTTAYDVNMEAMYMDYEELLQDELHLASSQKPKKTAALSQLRSLNSSDSFLTPELLFDKGNPTSPDCEITSIGSHDSRILPSRHGFEELNCDRLSNSTPELTSDNDSDCGVIDGRSAKRNKKLQQIDLSSSHSKEEAEFQESNANSSSQSISLLATNVKQNTINNVNMLDLENKENKSHSKTKLRKPIKRKKLVKKKVAGKIINRTTSLTLNNKKHKSQHNNNKLRASSDTTLFKISKTGSTANNFVIKNTKDWRHTVLQDSPASMNLSASPPLIDIREDSQNNISDKSNKHTVFKQRSTKHKLGHESEPISNLKTSTGNVSNDSRKTSGSEYMPSLRIPVSSSFQEIEVDATVNAQNNILDKNGLNFTSCSLIDRLSRIAIRGSGDTVDGTTEGVRIIQNISSLNNTSKDSFRSSSSSKSSSKSIHENVSDAIDLLASDEDERETRVTSQTLKPQNLNQLPKRKMRKLYDPEQPIDEAHQMWVEEENRKAFNIPNKQLIVSLVPVAPILLTTKAKKFLKYLQKNKQTNLGKKGAELNVSTQKLKEKITKKKEIKNKITKKTKALKVVPNDENDEQSELTDEIVNKGRRKSLRLAKRCSQSPVKRRSTLDFVTTPRARVKEIFNKNRRKIKPRIVCTRFHKPDVLLFTQIVKKLGTFFVEDEVSKKTTHLVVGESRRTINLLRAIARGCWILKQEWLLRSLEEGKWLPEEEYELTEFSPAVQQCRLHRQAFGPTFTMDIFENCGLIYIARSSNPRRSDLEELVLLCKGKLSHSIQSACIVVGEWVRFDVTCVSEQWILDSITCNRRKSFKKYLLQ